MLNQLASSPRRAPVLARQASAATDGGRRGPSLVADPHSQPGCGGDPSGGQPPTDSRAERKSRTREKVEIKEGLHATHVCIWRGVHSR